MAVVMKVAHERHAAAGTVERLSNFHDGARRLRRVDRQADKFGACAGKRKRLRSRCLDVRRGRIGHRLHDNGMAAADENFTAPPDDAHGVRAMAPESCCANGGLHVECLIRSSIRLTLFARKSYRGKEASLKRLFPNMQVWEPRSVRPELFDREAGNPVPDCSF